MDSFKDINIEDCSVIGILVIKSFYFSRIEALQCSMGKGAAVRLDRSKEQWKRSTKSSGLWWLMENYKFSYHRESYS